MSDENQGERMGEEASVLKMAEEFSYLTSFAEQATSLADLQKRVGLPFGAFLEQLAAANALRFVSLDDSWQVSLTKEGHVAAVNRHKQLLAAQSRPASVLRLGVGSIFLGMGVALVSMASNLKHALTGLHFYGYAAGAAVMTAGGLLYGVSAWRNSNLQAPYSKGVTTAVSNFAAQLTENDEPKAGARLSWLISELKPPRAIDSLSGSAASSPSSFLFELVLAKKDGYLAIAVDGRVSVTEEGRAALAKRDANLKGLLG